MPSMSSRMVRSCWSVRSDCGGCGLLWAVGGGRREGGVRLYALVQFYPMRAIPLVALLFPSRYTRGGDLVVVVLVYGLAKVFELLDGPLLGLGGVVSGHTCKHV